MAPGLARPRSLSDGRALRNAGLLGAVAHFQTTVLDTRLPGLGVALSNLLSVVIGK